LSQFDFKTADCDTGGVGIDGKLFTKGVYRALGRIKIYRNMVIIVLGVFILEICAVNYLTVDNFFQL